MREESNVYMRRMIVHILDQEGQIPVLSEIEDPLSNDEIRGFLEGHILKALKDSDLKDAHFSDENIQIKDMIERLSVNIDEFVFISKEIGGNLFKIMLENVDIPPCDLVISLFDISNIIYLGIFKFNYKPSYIHYVDVNDGERINTIIKQKTTLPGEGQRIEECAIINLSDLSLRILEKKYEINGEKEFYFSKRFLGCRTDISDKEKVRIFKKANQSFNKNYYDDNYGKTGDIRKAVKESIEEKGSIDVIAVADDVFKNNGEMKNAYIHHMEEAGFKEKSIPIDKEFGEKVFRNQKIKTDTGIEINLPIDYFRDNSKLEFINNADGTISILIKNINKIIDK